MLTHRKCDCEHPRQARRAVALLASSVACVLALSACDMFTSADTHVERAREHMAAGDFPRAMHELKVALEAEPQHVQSRLSLAQLLLRLGDVKGADKEIERAISAGASPQQTRKLHYESLVAQRNWEQLLQEMEKERQTPLLDRQVLEAQARLATGQFAEAERVLAQASTTVAADGRVLLQRTRLLAATERTDEALALAEKIGEPPAARAQALTVAATIRMSRGQYQAAGKMLTDALAIAQKQLAIPEQLQIAVALTESNLALQDLAAASKTLDFIRQRAGDSLIAHYYRARIALLNNDYTLAVAECQRALAIDANHVPSNLLLAAAHVGHGSLEQGEEVLQRLVAADPQNLAARKLLARVYLAKRRPDEARRLLEASGAGGPDDAQSDWLMGIALTESGQTEPGLAYLERSIAAAAPDDPRRLDLAAAYLGAGAGDKARSLLAGLPASVTGSNRAAALRLAAAISGKDRAAAQKEAERLIAESPDTATLSAVGAYLLGTGSVQRSQEVLTLAAERDAQALSPRMLLAELAARRLDWSLAAKRLDEVLAVEPKYQPALLMKAELALRQGDHAAAQRALEQAIGRDPSALEPRLRLARLAFADNDAARGRDLLKQLVTLLPNRPDVRNDVGTVLLQAGLHEEALVHFAEAGAGGSAEGMLNAARVHMQLNRSEQAAEAANAALRLRAGWRDAQRLLIEIDVRRGQLDRALAAARAQAGVNPPPGAADELVGDVYVLAKRYEDALTSYERAQRSRPSAAVALKMFQIRQALNRKPVEASLLAWLDGHGDDIQVRRALAAYYEATGQRRLAITHYERAVTLSPQDPLLLNNLAWQLHVDGDARALGLARRAYDLSPRIPEIADTYGWLLAQTGEMKQGLEVLEQALAGAPGNPDIRYHVAKARSQVGNRSGALQILDDLLRERTTFAARAEAEKLLETLRGEGA